MPPHPNPATALAPVPAAPEAAAPAPLHLGLSNANTDFILQYWLAIRRHLLQIGLFVFATVAVTALIVFRIPKQYEGVATVRLDPQISSNVVNGSPDTSQNVGSPDGLLATDMLEIKSPAVVIPSLMQLQPQAASGPASDPFSPAQIAKVTANIKVIRPPATFMLEIHDRAASPGAAAAMANTLANQFIQHEFDTRSEALKNLSGYMRLQVEDLRARMEKSQLALNEFARNNNLANPDDKFNLLDQELQSLTAELTQQQSRQRTLQSELALVKAGNLDALVVSDRGQDLAPLLAAREAAQVDFSKLSSQYGPGNYLYQQAQGNLAHLNQLIADEEKHIATQIQSEAQQVDTQTALTAAAFDRAKADLDASNAKAVQYSLLKGEADSDQSLYNDLLTRLNAADVTTGYHSNALRVVNPARPDPTVVYPQPGWTILFAGLLALALGVGTAIGISGLDPTFTNPEAVRVALGQVVLASLPSAEKISTTSLIATSQSAKRRSPYAEAILGLRTTLMLGATGKVRSLMVASAQPQEGKSTTTANLAAAFSLIGLRTLLVDADIRRPQVHRAFDASNRVGLSSLLQKQAATADAIQATAVPNLYILPAGLSVLNPTELLAIHFGELLEELKAGFDIVLVDTPPLLDFADARTVAACVDASILVIRAGNTPRDLAVSAIQELHTVRARISGVILNAVNPQMSHYYHYRSGYYKSYGYGGYYSRYYGPRDEDNEEEEKALEQPAAKD